MTSSWDSFSFLFTLTVVISAIATIYQEMRKPYIPGPLSTKITKWVLRWHEVRNTRDPFIESLHKRYGALVQIAPNHISVNSADGVRDIFAINRRLDRPSPLPIMNLYRSENLVSTESGELHQQRRRPLRSLYSAKMAEGEQMQAVFGKLLGKLVEFVDGQTKEKDVLDTVLLTKLFAADLMSRVVYGSENGLNLLGNEEQRSEFAKDLEWSEERILTYWSLLMLWFPNVALWLQRTGFFQNGMPSDVPSDIVMDKKGRQILEKVLSEKYEIPRDREESLMERIVSEYTTNGPSKAIPDTNYILSDCLDHFWAGITTTSDALAAAFYLLSHPENKARQEVLRNELKAAGIVPGSEIPLSKVKTLGYLDSVVKETLRHSMPIPFTLSRKVGDEEGMQILGHWIPQGTEIGAQSYSVHRNLEAFSDPESWKPERWDANEDPEKLTLMRRHMFAFSAGPRMCIGMNIALTEMKLFLARVYSVYETQLPTELLDESGNVKDEKSQKQGWPIAKDEPIVFRRL